MWHLINNELRVMIDPLLFAFKQRIEEKVALVDMLNDYTSKIEPSLCKVSFYYPKYSEEVLGSHRSFFPSDEVVNIDTSPAQAIAAIELPKEITELSQDFSTYTKIFNEAVTLAVENKCLFVVTQLEIPKETRSKIQDTYGVTILRYEELIQKIEVFLQGFYNYYKFSSPIYGIDSPNLAHQMVNSFINKNLHPLEAIVTKKKVGEACKERVRSFIHNRYPDLLVAADQVYFFKMQQQLDAIRTGNLHDVNPRFHSSIIYHLNFYYYLLYGAIDHLAWVTNDLLLLGFDLESGRAAVGFKVKQSNKNRKNFLERLLSSDKELYEYIVSEPFQEWLFFLGEVRNQAAHREIFTAGPLVTDTPESKLSDEEIDAILYADEPPIPPDILRILPEGFEESKRIQDRQSYRISKMEIAMEHVAVVEKDGKKHVFNPIERIEIDMKQLNELIIEIIKSYDRKLRDPELKLQA